MIESYVFEIFIESVGRKSLERIEVLNIFIRKHLQDVHSLSFGSGFMN